MFSIALQDKWGGCWTSTAKSCRISAGNCPAEAHGSRDLMKAPVSVKKRSKSKPSVEATKASTAAKESRQRATASTPIVNPARRRRRSRRSEATIAAILEAAENVVLRSGVHRVAILNVCKAAGI